MTPMDQPPTGQGQSEKPNPTPGEMPPNGSGTTSQDTQYKTLEDALKAIEALNAEKASLTSKNRTLNQENAERRKAIEAAEAEKAKAANDIQKLLELEQGKAAALAQELESMKAEKAKRERLDLARKAALDAGFGAEELDVVAPRLVGETAEDLAKDAKALFALKGPPARNANPDGLRGGKTPTVEELGKRSQGQNAATGIYGI